MLLSAVVWVFLPDCPGSVKWLSEGEKKMLEADVSCWGGRQTGDTPVCHKNTPTSLA